MITVKCAKCGHMQLASAADIITGINCQQCNAAMRIDDGTASRFDDNQDTINVEKCPRCMSELSCRADNPMPLAWCDVCNQPFIRMQLPEFSSRRSSWETEKLFQFIEQATRARIGWGTIDRSEIVQVRVLRGLGITNGEISPAIANPLVQGIFHRCEQELTRNYRNFRWLPETMQLRICLTMARSQLLHTFYLQNDDLSADQMEPLIRPVLQDDDLYPWLSRQIDARSQALIGEYLREFARVFYNCNLDEKTQNYFVLKTYAAGVAMAMRDSSYFIYYPETGQVRATNDLNANGRKIFYEMDEDIRMHLHQIFEESGDYQGQAAGVSDAVADCGCTVTALALALIRYSSVMIWPSRHNHSFRLDLSGGKSGGWRKVLWAGPAAAFLIWLDWAGCGRLQYH